ncbi:hypothetical protein RH430_001807 [Raoultella ornithinolytica]|nr:hypothetical protein [Raoultella ornithinolytica]
MMDIQLSIIAVSSISFYSFLLFIPFIHWLTAGNRDEMIWTIFKFSAISIWIINVHLSSLLRRLPDGEVTWSTARHKKTLPSKQGLSPVAARA